MRSLLWVGVLVLVPCVSEAGGFTQPEGGYYAKVWDRTLIGSQAFNVKGDLIDLGSTFQDHQLNVYGEYGFDDDLTLILALTPFGLTTFEDTTRIYAGTLAVGARHRLTDGERPLALEVRVGGRPKIGDDPLETGTFNTGSFVVRSTLPTLFFDTELQAGLPLPYGIWATAGIGARLHTRADFSPALFGNLQLGMSTSFGLVVDLHLAAFLSVDPPDVNDVLGVAETDYIGVGIGIGYWFTDRVGVTLGVDGAILARANAGAAPLQIGLQLKG